MAIIQQERKLLLLAGMVLWCGLLAVDLAHGKINTTGLLVATGLILVGLICQFIIRKTGHTGDPLFLPLAVVLTAIGLIMVYRLKPELFLLQAGWVAVGLTTFVVTACFFRRMPFWADYKYIWGVIGVVLLVTTALFGTEIGGHKSWLILGPVRFQPAEFAKLFIVLFLAGYLDERRGLLTFATKRYGPLVLPHPRFLAPLLAVWGLAMLMLVLQRDIGSAMFYFGTALILTYLASGRKTFVVWGGALFVLGLIAAYYLFPHVRVRFDIWLSPWTDPNGRAYQIVQSLFALGSGGVLGSGLTYGFPELIPEVHTDFIFSAIGEEMGLMGSGAVMLLYMVLVYRAFRVPLQARTSFDILLSMGFAVLLALQIFVIIGGVTKFLPLTGVPLPFVSYGGSSMVTTFCLLGVLFAMSEARSADA
ncbi:MAG: FtsW/RodA/SpoVE family cell cycle protein [Negativicutes bacterium]|nr:FtsW/RodA/SpoVE family cell cycle protein [Negativicutes bacterium]